MTSAPRLPAPRPDEPGRGAAEAARHPAESGLRAAEAALQPSESVRRAAEPPQAPTALLYGPGQMIVHGNPAFVAEFGPEAIGMPARETLVEMPPRFFEVVDRVLGEARPLACWLEVGGVRRRLTAAPRRDVETGEIYGAAIRIAYPEQP